VSELLVYKFCPQTQSLQQEGVTQKSVNRSLAADTVTQQLLLVGNEIYANSQNRFAVMALCCPPKKEELFANITPRSGIVLYADISTA
jgi:hypothetical protein